jgi:hypothetical protein
MHRWVDVRLCFERVVERLSPGKWTAGLRRQDYLHVGMTSQVLQA